MPQVQAGATDREDKQEDRPGVPRLQPVSQMLAHTAAHDSSDRRVTCRPVPSITFKETVTAVSVAGLGMQQLVTPRGVQTNTSPKRAHCSGLCGQDHKVVGPRSTSVYGPHAPGGVMGHDSGSAPAAEC